MNELGLAVVVVGTVWLGVLTVLVLVLVRQLAVITVRLKEGIAAAAVKGGLAVGMTIPSEVRAALPELERGPTYLLLTSATCGPCQELVPELREISARINAVALLPGHAKAADVLEPLFPRWIRVVRDPAAYALAQALQIDSTPFAMALDKGRVMAKSHIKKASDFSLMIESVESSRTTADSLEVART